MCESALLRREAAWIELGSKHSEGLLGSPLRVGIRLSPLLVRLFSAPVLCDFGALPLPAALL